MSDSSEKFLDLDKIIKNKAPSAYKYIPKFFINWLKRKVHIDELNHILDIFEDRDGVDFMTSVVEYFNLTLKIEGLENIPLDGRFIFVSNHPLGGLDGICLSAVVGDKYDKEIKYLVNDILYFIPNLKSIFIPVNKHGGQDRNLVQVTHEAFASDKQIITFPAGLCSRRQKGIIKDLEWKKNFIQKAVEFERDIVPVHFQAHNSNFFYSFANIRKRLGIKFNIEMLYLPNEMMKNKNSTFTITFGKPIPYSTFNKTKSQRQWAQHVKDIVYNYGKNRE